METNNNNGNLNKLKEIENDCVAKYTELLNLLKGNYIRMQPLRLPFMPERTLYCYGIFTALHPALESVVPRIRDEWPTLGAFDLLVHEQSIKTALIRAYEGFSEENKMQLARFMEQHYSHCTEELMKTKAFQFANKGQVEQFVETWTDKWMERFVMENGNFGVPDLNAARTQLECDGVLKWKKEYLDKAMEMVRERQRKTVEHFYEEVDTKMRSSEVLKACLTSGEFGQEVYPDEQLVEWLKPYISKAVDEFIMDSSGLWANEGRLPGEEGQAMVQQDAAGPASGNNGAANGTTAAGSEANFMNWCIRYDLGGFTSHPREQDNME